MKYNIIVEKASVIMKDQNISATLKLIKLDYGVLAMVSQGSMSGYDITNRLKHIWNTSHSRIYPVLAKLEKLGLAEYTIVKQVNKPDKKLYHITEKGIDELKAWVGCSTKPKSMKDETLLKFICINLFDKTFVKKLLDERIATIETEKQNILKTFDDLISGSEKADAMRVSMQILAASILVYSDLEKSWCTWATSIYASQIPDVEKHSFIDYLKTNGFNS